MISSDFRKFQDKIKEIIETFSKEKKYAIHPRLIEINESEIFVEITGNSRKAELCFADMKVEYEKLLNETLFVEYISNIENTVHRITFRGKRDNGPADEILSILSKYDEGVSLRSGGFED